MDGCNPGISTGRVSPQEGKEGIKSSKSCTSFLRGRDSQSSSEGNRFLGIRPVRYGAVYPLIPGRLSFAVHTSIEMTQRVINEQLERFYFSSDSQERYDAFCADFGPVNLGIVHVFCNYVLEFYNHPQLQERELVYYVDKNMHSRANAAFLLAAFMVIKLRKTPEAAWAPFQQISEDSFPKFRDATYCAPTYELSILACLQGLDKAMQSGFYDPVTFDLYRYCWFDDPCVADLHFVSDKFIMFKGPRHTPRKSKQEEEDGFFPPEHYIELFKDEGVSAVVRLNEASTYDKRSFTNAGIAHHDLYFDDCTVPTDETVNRFLALCESEPGLVAVHCKAGLGRTGTLIAVYLMKHFDFTASECIGWLRIVRPGSIIGPQQQYLHSAEDQYRASNRAKHAHAHAHATSSASTRHVDLVDSEAMGRTVADAQNARAARLATRRPGRVNLSEDLSDALSNTSTVSHSRSVSSNAGTPTHTYQATFWESSSSSEAAGPSSTSTGRTFPSSNSSTPTHKPQKPHHWAATGFSSSCPAELSDTTEGRSALPSRHSTEPSTFCPPIGRDAVAVTSRNPLKTRCVQEQRQERRHRLRTIVSPPHDAAAAAAEAKTLPRVFRTQTRS